MACLHCDHRVLEHVTRIPRSAVLCPRLATLSESAPAHHRPSEVLVGRKILGNVFVCCPLVDTGRYCISPGDLGQLLASSQTETLPAITTPSDIGACTETFQRFLDFWAFPHLPTQKRSEMPRAIQLLPPSPSHCPNPNPDTQKSPHPTSHSLKATGSGRLCKVQGGSWRTWEDLKGAGRIHKVLGVSEEM